MPRSKTGRSPGLSTSHSSTDRKSTRLNSSHLGISYAVFCLKKKKKNTNNETIKILTYNQTHTILAIHTQTPQPWHQTTKLKNSSNPLVVTITVNDEQHHHIS